MLMRPDATFDLVAEYFAHTNIFDICITDGAMMMGPGTNITPVSIDHCDPNFRLLLLMVSLCIVCYIIIPVVLLNMPAQSPTLRTSY